MKRVSKFETFAGISRMDRRTYADRDAEFPEAVDRMSRAFWFGVFRPGTEPPETVARLFVAAWQRVAQTRASTCTEAGQEGLSPLCSVGRRTLACRFAESFRKSIKHLIQEL